jgi:hypothetical protein
VTSRERAAGTVVEPGTGYGAARLQQDLRGGESGIGAMATVMHRALDARSTPYLRDDALAIGVDARHRFVGPLGGRYQLAGSLAASRVGGSPAAIARAQRSAVHYYQRPDDALRYDTTRTALGGTSLELSAAEVAGTWRWGASYERLSPGFETNDLGFLARADQQSATAYVRAVGQRPRAFWRSGSITATSSAQFTAQGLPIGRLYELFGSAQLRNAAQVSADLWTENAGVVYCDRCARGGPALRVSPSTSLLVNAARDERRSVKPQIAAIYTVGDGGRSILWRVRPYVVVRPSTGVSFELGTRYQRNRDATQWYANVVDSGVTRFLFARLDQRLLSFTSRLDVTATPTLSLQLYAEPFVSAGSYDRVRAMARPREARYDDRFTLYALRDPVAGFNEKAFHSTAVLRWEYRPGSTLFVVWSQGREESGRDAGSFSASRDYGNLFGARPDNTIAVKLSYWLGR